MKDGQGSPSDAFVQFFVLCHCCAQEEEHCRNLSSAFGVSRGVLNVGWCCDRIVGAMLRYGGRGATQPAARGAAKMPSLPQQFVEAAVRGMDALLRPDTLG